MKHYIIIEVRDEPENDPRAPTNAARVRKAIHKYSEQAGINLADIIVRGDTSHDYFGHPTIWPLVSTLFSETMDHARRATWGWRR